MNNNKPFGNIDFSEFIVPRIDCDNNVFMQNQQRLSLPAPVSAMVQATGQTDSGIMNPQNTVNPPVSGIVGFGNDTVNRKDSAVPNAMPHYPAHMKENVMVMPGATPNYGAQASAIPPQRNMMQYNGNTERSVTMNNPMTPSRESFNPYADYLNASKQSAAGSSNCVMEANMQGPIMPIPNSMPNPNQFVPSLQVPNMPGLFPVVFPGFSSGMGRASGKKKSVKATAYDIMADFISKVPVFTHKQEVYVYDDVTGSYNKTPQCEVEQMIMEMYRPIIRESGSGSLIEKVYKLLLKEPQIVRNEVPLSDPNKVSFANCTIDLNNRTLMEHSPANVVTHAVNCNLARYNNQSENSPVFDKFLHDITGGDTTLQERIWQVFGYCLTSDRNAKAYFLFQGVPDSGKSILCNLLGDFYPEDKVSGLNVHALKGEFAMGNLDSVALCLSPDLPPEPLDTKSTSCVKQATGNDKISAAVKHKGNKQFRFEGKFILTTNYPLVTEEPDDAFMRRAVVIPFFYTVPQEAKDEDLLDRLKEEKPAIASKALDAYFRLRDNHYKFAGDYAVNSSLLYPDDLLGGAEITPFVYNFLMNYFEKDPGGQVAVGDAYEMFSREISNQFTEKMFSASFQRMAEEIYGANKTRSYHDGKYKNARSTIEGIRFKHMIFHNN